MASLESALATAGQVSNQLTEAHEQITNLTHALAAERERAEEAERELNRIFAAFGYGELSKVGEHLRSLGIEEDHEGRLRAKRVEIVCQAQADLATAQEALWVQGRDDGDGWHSWYCWSLAHTGRCTTSCEQARAALPKP
jgi:hypothetical protein